MANHNLKNKNVLLRPRITEKAAIAADKLNTYVFEVDSKATKASVKASVKASYNVTPVRVNITRIADKAVVVRGKRGVKRGGKKAYVELKKGDKIELI